MSRERLEELKEWFYADKNLHQFQIEWLFEQAERVQELEDLAEHRLKMLKYCSDARRKYYGVIKKLYHFDGDVQEHSALADVLCSEILEGDLDE